MKIRLFSFKMNSSQGNSETSSSAELDNLTKEDYEEQIKILTARLKQAEARERRARNRLTQSHPGARDSEPYVEWDPSFISD